jgi:hypothetical protein
MAVTDLMSFPEEFEDHWGLPFVGERISRCLVDGAFHLQFLDRKDPITVSIESPFTLTQAGVSKLMSPQEPLELGPALGLLNGTVVTALAHKTGHLCVEMDAGRILTVSPDDQYEAWSIVSDNNLKIVCTPGGTIALWT